VQPLGTPLPAAVVGAVPRPSHPSPRSRLSSPFPTSPIAHRAISVPLSVHFPVRSFSHRLPRSRSFPLLILLVQEPGTQNSPGLTHSCRISCKPPASILQVSRRPLSELGIPSGPGIAATGAELAGHDTLSLTPELGLVSSRRVQRKGRLQRGLSKQDTAFPWLRLTTLSHPASPTQPPIFLIWSRASSKYIPPAHPDSPTPGPGEFGDRGTA
jgi:hypothetical protein